MDEKAVDRIVEQLEIIGNNLDEIRGILEHKFGKPEEEEGD